MTRARWSAFPLACAAAALLAFATPSLAQTADPAKPAEAAPAAPAPAPETVVAKVGNSEITERDLAFATADLAQQFAQVPDEQRRAAVLNALIEIKLLAQEAEKAKIEENEAFQARMKFLRERALHNQLFQNRVVEAITAEEVKARYDKEIAAIPPQEEVKARHILVKSKEEAEAVIKDLEAGKSFEELAKEKTIDPSGTQSGGDLGWFGRGQMVGAVEEAAFALEKGAYTKTPVETQFGFHVILKEDQRVTPPPALEEVESQVRQLVMRDKYRELVDGARAAATVDVLDAGLKAQLDEAKAKE